MQRTTTPPRIQINRIGIVSRNYSNKFANGYRDFSDTLLGVIKLLDNRKCDAVLFSLYTLVPRESNDYSKMFSTVKNLKAIFVEEYQDGSPRTVDRYIVLSQSSQGWMEYEIHQKFATLTGMDEGDILAFVSDELPKRILGNSVILLCGESNGVKYSKHDKSVHDPYGLIHAIAKEVNIILNPVHDRMTRFEMNLKREFLSMNNRWVISVWNKGKQDKNGRIKDGLDPAWTVYHNGVKMPVEPISNDWKLEIGIVDVGNK